MSTRHPFATQLEKKILDLLKEKGAMLYSDIRRELSGKQKGFSEKSLNRCLKEMVNKKWVFRIVRENRPWYRINDFPLNVKAAIYLLELLEENYPGVKGFAQKFIENLCIFYGQLPLDRIYRLAAVDFYLEAKIINDPIMKAFLQKLKQS